MVFASIREHPEYCDFFASTCRDKKFALRAASSLESTTREQRGLLIFSACSNPYGNPFLWNKTENILKRGFNLYRWHQFLWSSECDWHPYIILTRKWACEQLQNFGEHEQASARLNVASKSSKGKILRAVKNFNGPFITPRLSFPLTRKNWKLVAICTTTVSIILGINHSCWN